MATTTFTLFPNLPTELRLQVWHEAFQQAALAVCDITTRTLYRRNPARRAKEERKVVRENTRTLRYPDPGPYRLGAVCREARALMTQHYAKPLDPEPSDGGSRNQQRRTYLVDAEKTIFYLGHSESMDSDLTRHCLDTNPNSEPRILGPKLPHVRHLAMSWSRSRFDCLAASLRRICGEYGDCASLTTLILQLEDEGPGRRDITSDTAAAYVALAGKTEVDRTRSEDWAINHARTVARTHCKLRENGSLPRIHVVTADIATAGQK